MIKLAINFASLSLKDSPNYVLDIVIINLKNKVNLYKYTPACLAGPSYNMRETDYNMALTYGKLNKNIGGTL